MDDVQRTQVSPLTARGTCSRCGIPVFGDGDIAVRVDDKRTASVSTRFLCVVCFLDPERMRECNEHLTEFGFDPATYEAALREARPWFDEMRGRELRRRVKRTTG